jgi:uncharacterized protein (TIGR04222 family)
VDRSREQPELLVTEIALLAGGAWAAARTGLAMLSARRRLETGRPGRINRTGSAPRNGEPLEKVLFGALLGWSGAREVAAKPRVRDVLRELRHQLERRRLVRRPWVRVLVPLTLVTVPGVAVARLVALQVVPPGPGAVAVLAGVLAAGWFLPRRTVAGARLLRRLRAEHPGVTAAAETSRAGLPPRSPKAVGLAVALFGDAALLSIMPAVAHRAGLLDGGRWTRQIRHGGDQHGPWTGAAMSEIDHLNPTSPFD